VARDGLRSLSRERVRAELMKLLVAPFAVPTLAVMAEAGFTTLLLGGVALLASFANMIKVEEAAGVAPDAVRRLGALGVFIDEDAERLRQKLRLFNSESDRLTSMANRWWRVSPALGEAGAQGLLYRLGPKRYVDRVLIAWTRAPQGAADRAWRALVALPTRWTAPRFPLKSADLIARGVPRGPALGAAMRAAEEAWIAVGFPHDEAAVDRLANDAARLFRK
jgi:tRNA nucleotidyltransferase/poly(A) polymerase